MKKYVLDFRITENVKLHDNYALLKLTPADGQPLPEMLPGQFVEVRVDRSPSTFLRRPISINFVDYTQNELWLLIRIAGEGTRTLCGMQAGEILNLVLPLGSTFTLPENPTEKLLLVGGGVGIAPMLYWGKYLKEKGYTPHFLLGFRSDKDLLQYDQFCQLGEVSISTEDGSRGEKGFVTQHSILEQHFDRLYVCGPKPMMVAVARYAREHGLFCEVSLENTMACGVGACLCCVEDTVEGHVCVCKEGPIFNIEKLKWQI
ncbi:dihydroorotate dehydrogenase electron transfer subunit [Barnesiella sp. An55]|uniref:dihydroorotate dehydrogenase electron transfer subunit n=1 Tax=Barnesiella sp. An55 TaxID=1965646 RepID=UPI000B3AC35D|nr:dihydroorotate dehydrogenase electron transfer subunit [Barnesiella sp. An55]OUN74781.1 dihydroorotate dehydrogenase electron transfer subunit [Barnesiella sp. An55]